jgi:dTDP-4-dehydrorhamnose 3,5-epimerase
MSETLPGASRGPHEHANQTDCFAFFGPGDFTLHLWDNRPGSPTQGRRMKLSVGAANPTFVLVPPGVVHAYKNAGTTPAWTLNAPNRLYAGRGRKEPVDEIRHENLSDCPFVLD